MAGQAEGGGSGNGGGGVRGCGVQDGVLAPWGPHIAPTPPEGQILPPHTARGVLVCPCDPHPCDTPVHCAVGPRAPCPHSVPIQLRGALRDPPAL